MKFVTEGRGDITVTTYHVIPFLVYFSKSILVGNKGKGGVYTLHLTPFFAVGIINPFLG